MHHRWSKVHSECKSKGEWIISHTSVSLNQTIPWTESFDDRMCVLQRLRTMMRIFQLCSVFSIIAFVQRWRRVKPFALCVNAQCKRYGSLGTRKHNQRMFQKKPLRVSFESSSFRCWLITHNDYENDPKCRFISYFYLCIYITLLNSNGIKSSETDHNLFSADTLFQYHITFLCNFFLLCFWSCCWASVDNSTQKSEMMAKIRVHIHLQTTKTEKQNRSNIIIIECK